MQMEWVHLPDRSELAPRQPRAPWPLSTPKRSRIEGFVLSKAECRRRSPSPSGRWGHCSGTWGLRAEVRALFRQMGFERDLVGRICPNPEGPKKKTVQGLFPGAEKNFCSGILQNGFDADRRRRETCTSTVAVLLEPD